MKRLSSCTQRTSHSIENLIYRYTSRVLIFCLKPLMGFGIHNSHFLQGYMIEFQFLWLQNHYPKIQCLKTIKTLIFLIHLHFGQGLVAPACLYSTWPAVGAPECRAQASPEGISQPHLRRLMLVGDWCWLVVETLAGIVDRNTHKWPHHVARHPHHMVTGFPEQAFSARERKTGISPFMTLPWKS